MLNRLSAILSGISKAFAALAVALLAILISYVVFARFVTHTTPHWPRNCRGWCWCGRPSSAASSAASSVRT